MSAPHDAGVAPLRTGGFWLTGKADATPDGTRLSAPAWVTWLAPADPRAAQGLSPLVLVHGGGGQGTDWLVTPDGRPGWAPAFAGEGRPVYVLDRVGHGRSPHHPAVGAVVPPVEASLGLFAPPDAADAHTAWPWSRSADGAEVRSLAASARALPVDFALAQQLDAARLRELIAMIGPSILVTHSAGAPAGWLAAATGDARALVAVEPMGPPYLDVPGFASLPEGLTSVPLVGDGLAGLPVLIVSGEASPFAGALPPVAEFLRERGARVDEVPLGGAGVRGNGHGLIFERNSEASRALVAHWLRELP